MNHPLSLDSIRPGIRDRVAELWREGCTNPQIAAKTGCSHSWVTKAIKSMGLTPHLRRKGGYTPEEDAIILAERKAGRTWQQIAEMINHSAPSAHCRYKVLTVGRKAKLVNRGITNAEIPDRVQAAFLFRDFPSMEARREWHKEKTRNQFGNFTGVSQCKQRKPLNGRGGWTHYGLDNTPTELESAWDAYLSCKPGTSKSQAAMEYINQLSGRR